MLDPQGEALEGAGALQAAAQLRAAGGAPLAADQSWKLPEVLDVLFFVISLMSFIVYHIWYYGWRRGNLFRHVDRRGYRRLDYTAQRARKVFVKAMLVPGADCNLAIQAVRNPITAAAFLATGTSVGMSTIVNILVDNNRMQQVHALGDLDPLTGGSYVFHSHVKMAMALVCLFLSFFSLAQSLRLFVHFGFCAKAANFLLSDPERALLGEGETLETECMRMAKKGQLFFSAGLRCLYMFIPAIMWILGGTYLVVSALLLTFALFELDSI